MIEFKTLARRDAFQRMESELQSLLTTCPDDRLEVKMRSPSFKRFLTRKIVSN